MPPGRPGRQASGDANVNPNILEERVRQLEHQLSVVTAERNDLAADVESLCMQGSGDIFSASSVLSERILQVTKEANRLQSQLDAVSAERASLYEDLLNHRASKRTVDKQWRLEREKSERLETELGFYQQQSARALSDRDKAVWEAEELKERLLATEGDLREAAARADTQATGRVEAERQLAAARQHIAELQVKVKEGEALPAVRRELAGAQELVSHLNGEVADLQTALAACQGELRAEQEAHASVQHELDALKESAAAAEAASEEVTERLNADVARLEAEAKRLAGENAALEARADEAEGGLAAAQAEMETSEKRLTAELTALRTETQQRADETALAHDAEATGLRMEVETLRGQYKKTKEELDKAVEERASALARIAAAEETATQAFEEVGNMRDEVADLRDRLAKATQEKVAALMQAAEARDGRRPRGAKNVPAASPGGKVAGQGWRVWGSGDGSASGELKGQQMARADSDAPAK